MLIKLDLCPLKHNPCLIIPEFMEGNMDYFGCKYRLILWIFRKKKSLNILNTLKHLLNSFGSAELTRASGSYYLPIFMVHFYDVLTSLIWVGSRVHSQEAAASCIGIRYHLYKHLVVCRNKGSWPECPTEPSKTLSIGMATINIHIIVAAQVVTL